MTKKLKNYRITNKQISNFIGSRTTLLNKLKIAGDYKNVDVTDALDSPWKVVQNNVLIVDGIGYDTHIEGFGITDDFTLCKMSGGEVVLLWNAERVD